MSETQHLAEQQQALMVEMQRLAAEVQSLRAVAAAGGPASEQKEKDKAKLGTPKPFNGHVGANVLTWLIGMESYLVGCSTPPNRWPPVASSYLEDSAKEWFHSFFVSTNGLMTWDTFKAGLLGRFRPVDSNRIGRAQLMELKMKSSDRGRGVLQYVNRFLQLVNQVSDITENEKFTYFNQGLTPELQRLLIPLTHINNVNDAISMVVKFEMLTQSNSDDRGTFRKTTPFRNSTPWTERRSGNGYGNGQGNGLPTVGTQSGSAGRPAPMELGAMDQHSGAEVHYGTDTETESANLMRSGRTGGRTKRLTQQELEHHLRQGLCFRCHKEGHLSRQCPLNESARS
jgi:Retrotransposon gag protein/Zinc knuckle